MNQYCEAMILTSSDPLGRAPSHTVKLSHPRALLQDFRIVLSAVLSYPMNMLALNMASHAVLVRAHTRVSCVCSCELRSMWRPHVLFLRCHPLYCFDPLLTVPEFLNKCGFWELSRGPRGKHLTD